MLLDEDVGGNLFLGHQGCKKGGFVQFEVPEGAVIVTPAPSNGRRANRRARHRLNTHSTLTMTTPTAMMMTIAALAKPAVRSPHEELKEREAAAVG